MARLMLVTDYAGLNMVKVFSAGDAAVAAVDRNEGGLHHQARCCYHGDR